MESKNQSTASTPSPSEVVILGLMHDLKVLGYSEEERARIKAKLEVVVPKILDEMRDIGTTTLKQAMDKGVYKLPINPKDVAMDVAIKVIGESLPDDHSFNQVTSAKSTWELLARVNPRLTRFVRGAKYNQVSAVAALIAMAILEEAKERPADYVPLEKLKGADYESTVANYQKEWMRLNRRVEKLVGEQAHAAGLQRFGPHVTSLLERRKKVADILHKLVPESPVYTSEDDLRRQGWLLTPSEITTVDQEPLRGHKASVDKPNPKAVQGPVVDPRWRDMAEKMMPAVKQPIPETKPERIPQTRSIPFYKLPAHGLFSLHSQADIAPGSGVDKAPKISSDHSKNQSGDHWQHSTGMQLPSPNPVTRSLDQDANLLLKKYPDESLESLFGIKTFWDPPEVRQFKNRLREDAARKSTAGQTSPPEDTTAIFLENEAKRVSQKYPDESYETLFGMKTLWDPPEVRQFKAELQNKREADQHLLNQA